ncbi:14101_t:CDS:1, partial [Cetraspora pellucida]
PYNYTCGQTPLDMQYLQRAFTHTGTLQIISARSRPAAYEGQVNTANPHAVETQQGIVDLKITKVGTLWRKAAKKKKARSPWQEWGAILTGSQLYLFKNASWAKGLVHQFMSHQRQGAPRMPVTFSPPLTDFKPDALIKTDNAVALVDSTYQRHKNAFTFVRPGGQEEVLLADNEGELIDWINLINYAAAFRAAGVRIRGMISGNDEYSRSRDLHRPTSAHTATSATSEVAGKGSGYDQGLTRQVMTARRQIMVQKIGEYDKEIANLQKQHDDILRNARHLLVLAPIPPKTREDIVVAAGRSDALLTWVRRDIWKMRCHRDILSLDIQQDGGDAGDKLVDTPDTAKKMPRMNSQVSGRSRSQPQGTRSPAKSERSPTSMRPRPSTTESMDTFVDDVFRSTVE